MTDAPHRLADLGVIVVAAGRGERLGAGTPKAFTELGGRTLIEHAVRTVSALSEPGQLVLVVSEARAAEALDIAAAVPLDSRWTVSIAHGGRERHESVRFGIEALHDGIRTVLVHDAARPLTPPEVFERVAAAVRRTRQSAVPAVAVADTLKERGEGDTVSATVDRSALVAVQTPQGFPLDVLAAAHQTTQEREGGASDDDAPTDDAELVQRAGGTVHLVEGSPYAHKLTLPADLLMLEGLLAGAAGTPHGARGAHARTEEGSR